MIHKTRGETGLLWQEPEVADCATLVARVAAFYRQKYGRAASLARVHAATPGLVAAAGEVRVETVAWIMPGYVWVGGGGERCG